MLCEVVRGSLKFDLVEVCMKGMRSAVKCGRILQKGHWCVVYSSRE